MQDVTAQDRSKLTSGDRLRRDDWIDAAWRILGKGNMNEIKINVLAKTLGVTRGSFYWHFKNRDDIVEALLDRWFSLLGLRESIEPKMLDSDAAEDRLFSVFRSVIETISGGQSIALRLHAKSDLKLRRRIDEEDRRRLSHFQSLFIQMGAAPERAMQIGKLYHAVVVSEFLRNGGQSKAGRISAARELHDALVASI